MKPRAPDSRTARAGDGARRPLLHMQSVERVVRVLRAIAAGGSARMRLTDVASAVDLTKATTARLLSALQREGLVQHDDRGRSWRLGAELLPLGWAASRHVPAHRASQPALERLALTSGDTTHLIVRSGDYSVCAARALGSHPIRVATEEVGSWRPLGVGAASLALLAALADDEIAAVLQRNSPRLGGFPGVSRHSVLRNVARTRARGFAFSAGQLVAGVSAIAVPVLDARRRPLAAISVAAISDRLPPPRIDPLLRAMRQTADDVAELLQVNAAQLE